MISWGLYLASLGATKLENVALEPVSGGAPGPRQYPTPRARFRNQTKAKRSQEKAKKEVKES